MRVSDWSSDVFSSDLCQYARAAMLGSFFERKQSLALASGSQRTFRTVRASHRLALLFAPRLTVPAGGTSMAERHMKKPAAEWESCRDATAACAQCHVYKIARA